MKICSKEGSVLAVIEKNGLNMARMIAGSKSLYCQAYPDRHPIFNANIFSKKAKAKVWHGDLDLKTDSEALLRVASEIGEFLVFREMDGRFGNETLSYAKAKERAVAIYSPEGVTFNK